MGLDEAWAALDAVEMSALAEAWPGGSIRKLRKLIETVLRARDTAPGISRH